MTDIEHINSFVNRWQYIGKSGVISTGGSDSELNMVTGRANFLTLANNKGRYFLYDPDNPLSARKWLPEGIDGQDYILLSDHNRSTAPFSIERLGIQKRMINGRMRGYHIADKLSVTLSWTDLPSRAFSDKVGYSVYSNPAINTHGQVKQYTADGGAGGMEMQDWYNSHVGSIWAFFSFDGVPSIGVPDHVSNQGYGRIYEMNMKSFDYEVKSRSRGWTERINAGTKEAPVYNTYKYGFDLWDVSMTLEEI